tara:strand:+ start:88 stop:726 length:639 start_codon:yes stop_codon:yes gene_type:complete
MRNLAKSVHVVLICAILGLGHLHSSNLIVTEETPELELEIYTLYEASEHEEATISDEEIAVLGTVLVVVAVPLAPVAILYVWASSLASTSSADQPESGTRNSYTATDANASVSAADDDTLMRITWQHAEEDLNWAFVVFRLSVGDYSYDCSTGADEECSIAQDGFDDALWETGEFLTLSENGYDLASSTTQIQIYVSYRGVQLSGTSAVTVA